MINNLIITLCGSTRFKDDFERINRELTLAGNIVLMPGVFGHSGDTITDDQKIQLDALHKRKIAMSNLIFIINKNGYIGESTKSEINFANQLGIPIRYMEENDK